MQKNTHTLRAAHCTHTCLRPLGERLRTKLRVAINMKFLTTATQGATWTADVAEALAVVAVFDFCCWCLCCCCAGSATAAVIMVGEL